MAVRASAGVAPAMKRCALQVTGDLLAGLQHRQHVDETKHLYLDGLIPHAPVEDLLVPPREVKHRRGFGLEAGKNLPAEDLGLLFDVVGKRHGRSPSQGLPSRGLPKGGRPPEVSITRKWRMGAEARGRSEKTVEWKGGHTGPPLHNDEQHSGSLWLEGEPRSARMRSLPTARI